MRRILKYIVIVGVGLYFLDRLDLTRLLIWVPVIMSLRWYQKMTWDSKSQYGTKPELGFWF